MLYTSPVIFISVFQPVSLFEGIMKRNGKRWSSTAPYNPLAYNKPLVPRDSNLISLLGVIAITHLLPYNINLCNIESLGLTTSLSKKQEHETIKLQ